MYNTEKSWVEDPKQLEGVAKRLESEHSARHAENKGYLRCYYDRPVVAADFTRPYREHAIFDALRDSFGGNLTREVVDAGKSIICRQLSSEVLPKGAEFELEQGCKQASRLIEGVYDNSNFISIAKRAFTDGCTADIGPTKGWIDPLSNEIKFERLDPLSVYWVDNGTDNPRTIMTMTAISRDELAARYPRFKSRIMDLPSWAPPLVVGVDPPGSKKRGAIECSTVKLVEGWCRALGEKHPGRHSVVAGDMVFEDESWTHEITPVFRFTWSHDFRGYGGVSLARIISRYDAANRRLLKMVYAGLEGAVPWLVSHEDSEVDGNSDVPFHNMKYAGTTPPTVYMPQTVSPEIIGQIEKNYTRAYAEGGVNQNMATGSAPARYTSGAAQIQFVDIANTRLLDAQQQWQQYWSDGSKVVVMLAQQAKKTHVRVKGANYYESVSFPKLSRDKYKVSFGLSSGLSLTPAGRLQELDDLQKAGIIDTADVLRHLDLPDTRQLADRTNAPRDLVMKQIGMALDQGRFDMPSAMQGDQLPMIVKIGGEEYQRARMQGNYPAKNMEVLRRLIKAAEARLAPPPTAPMGPPPANDNGMGMPAPAPAPMDPNAPPPPAPMPAAPMPGAAPPMMATPAVA
jgi:hypothetical protein